jgi:hypothetical protein
VNVVTLVVIGRLLASIACTIVSGALAYEGKEGWGWFLFAAVWLGAITASSGKESAIKE